MSKFKVMHHVKKLQDGIDITDSSESTVVVVVENLLSKYKEYQFEPRQRLNETVKDVLETIVQEERSKLQVSTPKVANLNQTMINQYSKQASKRHRPIEYDTPVDRALLTATNDTDIPNAPTSETNVKLPEEIKTNVSNKKAQRRSSGKVSSTKEGSSIVGNTLQAPLSSAYLAVQPKTRLADLAGIDSIQQQIQELVFYPRSYPHLYTHLGVSPPCGILLHGPSGCGKTMLATAIAGELGLPFFKASGPELVGGTSGESEERIRQIFETAAAHAPSVLFIDAIDVIAAKKESSQRGMERRIVAQLFDSIDFISSLGSSNSNNKNDTDTEIKDNDTSTISVQLTPEQQQMQAAQALIFGNAISDPFTNVTISSGSSSDSAVDSKEVSKDIAAIVEQRLIQNKANSINDASLAETKNKHQVVLIAATNKPDSLDPGVRGRFSREIALPVPDAPARSKILRLLTSPMRLSPQIDFELLGKWTPGFVGADLQSLTREAGMLAVSRIVKMNSSSSGGGVAVKDNSMASSGIQTQPSAETISTTATTTAGGVGKIEEVVAALPQQPILPLASCYVEMTDFALAAKSIQPTAKREGFAVAPDVTWSDVGALAAVREELLHNVLEPIAHPERYRRLGLEVPAGVLFFGPPGCGKTLLAKALANQSGANFISVKGPELLSMYVGESESKVRQVFARARASAPCVIFFDELDALCPKRGGVGSEGSGSSSSGSSNNGVSDRVVNQLLTELDGLETRKDVYIIAATNRLELIDDAMLRPGRLGKLLYVPLPSPHDRISILRALTKKVSIKWKKTDKQQQSSLLSSSSSTTTGKKLLQSSSCSRSMSSSSFLADAAKTQLTLSDKDPINSEDDDDDGGVDLLKLASDSRADGFSGADLAALVREAGLAVVREIVNAATAAAVLDDQTDIIEVTENNSDNKYHDETVDNNSNIMILDDEIVPQLHVCESSSDNNKAVRNSNNKIEHVIQARHFEAAFGRVRASVSIQDRERYELVRTNIQANMGAIEALQKAAKTLNDRQYYNK